MNTHKHTPGPWKLNSLDSGTNDDGTIIGPNNTVITADIFGRNAEEAEANAHLIEAAPDMLNALKEAVELLESYLTDADREASPKGRWPVIRAAIAKAEGGV